MSRTTQRGHLTWPGDATQMRCPGIVPHISGAAGNLISRSSPVLAATLSAHGSAAFDVHVLAGLDGDAVEVAGSGFAVVAAGEEVGERVDGVEQQCVDLGLPVGGVLGAVAGDELIPSGGCVLLVLGGLVSGLVAGPPPAQCPGAGDGPAGGR